MTKKTKRLAKGLGASALAVATIASGLSFGTAATAAPSARIDDTFQMVVNIGGHPFLGVRSANTRLYVTSYSSAAAARAGAMTFRYDGRTGYIHEVDGDRCLVSSVNDTYLGACSSTGSAPATKFKVDSDGYVYSPLVHGKVNSYLLSWNSQLHFDTNQYGGHKVRFSEGFGSDFDKFSAGVTSVDIPGRSAIAAGHGTPGAAVVLRWGDGEFESDTRVNDQGEWDFELDNLKLGSNPVKLLQYENQELTGEYELDVELKVADLVVNHAFGDSDDDLVTLSGTAQGGALVQVFNEDDQMVVSSEPANSITGAWKVELPAPKKGGQYDLNVYQTLQGERTSKTPLSIDYGQQLVVDRPEAGFAHPGGQLDARGTGEPGATVEVHEGDRRVGGPTTVRATGNWSLKTVDLNASEHKLTVTQKSKGGNVQSETIVVNPGEGAVELTADGRFDASDATKPAVAFGAAPTGSTVILRNSVGAEIGRTVAQGDAYEIVIDPARVTSGVNTFSVIIAGAPAESKSFTLNYGQPAAAVVVTTPTKNGTVEPGTVAFAGTGQAGAKIVVRGSSREVASATVNAQGAWSADSTVALGNGKYDLYFDQTSKGGIKSTIRHAFTIGQTAPIVTPHTVTSPGAGEVLETLTPEFRGTGHDGATITVRGSSRVVATGTVSNGQWVAQTNENTPLAPGSYNLYVDQSIRGTVTSTIRVAFVVSNEAFRELTLSAPAQGENVTTLRPTFVGTATPGAEIRVGSSRTTVATATAGSDGTWRATALFDLAKGGTYAGLEVKQTTKSGKTSTVSSTFTVDRNAQ